MSVIFSDSDNSRHIHGFDKLKEAVARIRAFAEAKELRLSPNCRLAQYERTLQLITSPVTEETRLVSLQAVAHEVDQLATIIDELGHLPELPRRFQQLLSGNADSLLGPERDPARDFQFELYLAGCLRRAGYEVQLAEPDVLVEMARHPLAIAAKRPRNIETSRDAIRKGIDQICRSGHAGFVALDFSLCPIDGLLLTLFASQVDDVPATATAMLQRFLGRVGSQILRDIRPAKYGESVFGCLVFLSLPITVEEPWMSTAGRCWGGVVSLRNHLEVTAQVVAQLNLGERRAFSATASALRSPKAG